MVDMAYLNTLPQVKNKYGVKLEDGEKVIFTAKLNVFGNEKDEKLGSDDSKFTLTNKRIIADNGIGVWTIDIEKDITRFEIETSKVLFFKSVYFAVDINEEVTYGNGEKLTGYHFYFGKSNRAKLEAIVNKAFH